MIDIVIARAALLLLSGGFLYAQEPLTLRQVLDEALQRNLQLIAQRYEISIAEARVLQAQLRPNPRVTVETNFLDWLGANFIPTEGPAGPSETNTAYVHTFETAGKRRLRTEAAHGAAAVARSAFLDASRNLVLNVQNAYLDLMLAKENVRILREILATFDNLVRVNRTRFESGEIARVELLRSEVAALQFRNQLRTAELRVRQESVRLQNLMGRPQPELGFDVQGEMRRDVPVITQDEVAAAALAARPDLEALRRDLRRAESEFRLQRAGAWPDVDAGLSHHKQYVNPFRGQTAGFRFEIPLPMYNRNQGEIERARQEREQAAARIRALEAEIRAQVASAWQQYLTARELLESMERDLIGSARRVRETIEFSYRRGEASFIDLLDAQRTFNETMQGYNESRAEYARTLYLLDAIAAREVR
jgi:cobalt-zinc-cadmium efflux system outer membrane protein